MELDNLTLDVWDKAEDCDCYINDCYQNHKLCGICQGTIIYTAHESNQRVGQYSWNIDHITPVSHGGRTILSNLRAVHVNCNRSKGNKRY